MLNFLDKLKLLNRNQFGFKPKALNTVEALVSLIQGVRQDWEDGIAENNQKSD